MAALFGRRLRRTAVTTAVAAAAVAALTASQAPGGTDGRPGAGSAAGGSDSSDTPVTGNSPYYTDLPPLKSPNEPPDETIGTGDAEAGIPASILAAYKQAESSLASSDPGCRLPWELLAAIGKVESGQARGGRVDGNGTTLKPILGPVLNGVGFANISDTDDGAYDGDSTHDRAVGPMQFIPSTWATWGQDADDDGKKDPNNIYDAALAAGRYLCANNRDLTVERDLHQAILGYNRSQEYLRTVLRWYEYYRKGAHEVPDGTGPLPVDSSGVNRPGASPSPNTPSGKPSKPGGGGTTGPSEPGRPGGGGGGDGGGGGSESPDPTPPPTTTLPPTTPPPTTPPATATALKDAGTGTLSATAGRTFAERVAVRAETSEGAPVAKVKVKFAIVGDTDSRFAGDATSAVVTTGGKGTATAPELEAGERTGEFVVRATVVGRSIPAVDHTAKVTARQADALARTSDKDLTCASGAEFADRVELKATYKGAAAPGVAATAALITTGDDPKVNDKGPYFKDADGKAVRELKDLKTGADGLLGLPRLYADDAAGTYLLRVTTTGGAGLTIELEVT